MIRPIGQRAIAAVVTAIVVTFVVLTANALAYYVSQGMALDTFGQVFEYYLPSGAILLLLTWLTAFLPLLSSRWWALAAGVVAGVVASFVGVGVQVASSNPDFLAFVDQALFGLTTLALVFLLATVIAMPTLGVWVNRTMREVLAERRGKPLALVRAPASTLANGLVTHVARKRVNLDLADVQWDAYVETLQECGWRIVEVDARDDLADSVFVEDTVVILGNTAIITSPGAPARVEETEGTEDVLRGLGMRIERIEQPGTLDGGDVLVVNDTVYVGRSTRTNADGIRQLRVFARRQGFTVVAVPVARALHLKSAASALPDGTVIGYAQAFENVSLFARFLPVSEPLGASVVVLSANTVLMSASAPKTAALVRDLGYRVITVEIGEFEKLEGSVTCLSVLIR
jgi:dimethylargininase